MDLLPTLLHLLAALVLCPLLFSVINRTKAFFGGRRGQPFRQPYDDLFKLLRKGAVYSRTTTWVFRVGPLAGLASVLVALALTPLGPTSALLPFQGDVFMFASLFGLMRFLTVLAALDTGSSFEGMGASREVHFSALTEVALLLGVAALASLTRRLSLTAMFLGLADGSLPGGVFPVNILAAAAFLAVMVTENARIPVDDPETHLELTMIHEAMILDHGGVDLALIHYGSALKLWVTAALVTGVALPLHTGSPWLDLAASVSAIFALAVVIGVIESTMARLRLLWVPQILVTAGVLSLLALVLVPR